MRTLHIRPADSVVKDNPVGAADLVDSVGKADLVVADAEEHHP